MDAKAVERELLRLGTREAAHHVALQVMLSDAPPELRASLRKMASMYEDLSLTSTIPDEWRAEFQQTLLSLAGEERSAPPSPLGASAAPSRGWSFARWVKRDRR
jgi:hypothetical protein